ncbi:alpha/beta hydrolase [Pseudorhodoferax sp.]|uniref:alpha/beta hydrolase n=1 Tax=Pseudorhodoferax sp. TaxID=1993553 RepID=UPI0039E27CD1
MRLEPAAPAGVQLLDGPAGPMEVLLDAPAGVQGTTAAGIAVVTHPQPLLGGHARHKLPQFLARALAEAGWQVARPNFRGVGASAGVHDEGRGEADDVLALCAALRAAWPGRRLALLGFSFGAFVQARVAHALAARGEPAWRVGLAGMPFGSVPSGRRFDTPGGIADALVVHGERDEVVPLANVLDWARPGTQPVVVVPGADHFFTGRLPVLRQLMLAHLAG